MLQDQFVSRLLLIVVFGVVYIYTMMKMASCNSVETSPQKHFILKILGGINVLLGVSCLVMGVFWLTQVQYPEQTIDLSYSANQIVRTSDKYVIWGYPTSEQSRAIMGITNVFSSLALAAYCFFYRKSDRKWWKKILRFFYGLLMYAFYCSATNFHYFDATEFVAPGLFYLMSGYALMNSKKRNMPLADKQKITDIHKMEDEESETCSKAEEETRFMPLENVLDVDKTNEESEVQPTDKPTETNLPVTEQNKVDEVSSNDSMKAVKYCRHCGRNVDYDSYIYCKYCGKEL
ncbi:hypothetical protein [Leyella stercorea]|uniref:hypothetical protein n=1 Tax=Leyella stercorea TaxID=363265 RepID=UPI0024304EC4|nr:hypothetical protein [Leyella stercorea]